MNNQWIKCSERLPEMHYGSKYKRDTKILVYGYTGFNLMTVHMLRCFILENDYTDYTHWMELPDRPEMEG